MSQPKTAKAGKLLCVDNGEHSNYEVIGFFVVLQDFDPMAELAEYLAANPHEREVYAFHGDAYLAGLLKNGLLVEVEHGNLYLGSYPTSHGEVSFTPSAG